MLRHCVRGYATHLAGERQVVRSQTSRRVRHQRRRARSRVRFMARSPDDRIFVTDIRNNLTDNKRGVVYILEDFDPAKREFKKLTKYLTGLRNPNSVAFYTDQSGAHWFYLALTDRLVRYRYQTGSVAPSGEPELLATFPDYGLGYKYGGWHLTRTVVVGDNGKISYLSAAVATREEKGRGSRRFSRWIPTGRTSVTLRAGCAMLSDFVG